jgi:hypothetical protein
MCTTYVTTTASRYTAQIKFLQWTIAGATDLELSTQHSKHPHLYGVLKVHKPDITLKIKIISAAILPEKLRIFAQKSESF